MTRFVNLALCCLLLLPACAARPDLKPASAFSLASFTENKVTVEIFLETGVDDQVWLSATFTPEAGYHLYSKDIPRGGVDGVGRPTLLELVPGSRLEPAGALTESVPARQDDGLEGLLTYPVGPVTLRLPVILPEGGGWFDEQVSVSFMACRDGRCSPPVVGKLVPVRVPGAQEVAP